MICRIVLLALLCSTAAGCFSQSQLPADRAQAAFDRQDYPAAEQFCSEQLSLHPDDFEMLMLRGRSHAMLGRHDSAVADFSRAAELAPNDPEPLYRRQLSYRELGQSDLADQDDLAAKSIDPQFGSAYQYDPSTFINRPRGVAARPTQRNGSADEDDIEDDTRQRAEEAVATDRRTDEADADDVAASEVQNRRTRNAAESTEVDGRSRHAQDRPRAGTASREPDDLMVIESPRRGSQEPVDELPEDPLTETEGLPDEEPSATRPIISTALPNLIPRGDITVPIAPSPSSQFPTTGLSPNRSVSEFARGCRAPTVFRLPRVCPSPGRCPIRDCQVPHCRDPAFRRSQGLRASSPRVSIRAARHLVWARQSTDHRRILVRYHGDPRLFLVV